MSGMVSICIQIKYWNLTSYVFGADHLKLNFPMAWAASVLAWGFIEFQDVSAAHPQSSCAGRAAQAFWLLRLPIMILAVSESSVK